LDAVGPEDDFFELGGDSLTAVRVLARLAEQLDVKLALRDLFDHPTVGDLAGRAELGAAGDASRPLPSSSAR
jgi:acyl carrier protein